MELRDQPNWIFRGQKDFSWTLNSTLERYHKALQERKNEVRNIYKLESSIWMQFIPPIENFLEKKITLKAEIASVLQHYKVPTRLLDFTKNLDVALYFATENKESKYCTLYAFNFKFLSTITALRAGYRKDLCTLNFNHVFETNHMDKYFKENNKYRDEIILINPVIDSCRIKAQEGCFLLPSNLRLPIERNLRNSLSRSAMNVSYPMYLKFQINDSVTSEISEYLNEQGITRDKLFPEEMSGMQELIDKLIDKHLNRF